MQNINVLWEGKLPLYCIRWNKRRLYEFKLPPKYDYKIQSCWNTHISENPKDYDGKLLFLDSFQFKDKKLYLNTSCIRFSTITFMEKTKIRVEKGIGVFGTQYLIYSPDKKYFLVGERALNLSYFPGATTIPGGILEIEDLSRTPNKALIRELNEEVSLPFHKDMFLNAILEGWNGISVTFLITINTLDSYHFKPNESIPADQDEWNNNLIWMSVAELKKHTQKQYLDGLIYYQSKLIEHSKNKKKRNLSLN
jgi:8-oxo-dGTP pyrophosphatase MutT (NUDIX family)